MILANMCILQAQRIAPKIYFFGIPDTRNTRWFWKKIGYGSGTAKNYRVGSGIGYPSVTAEESWEYDGDLESESNIIITVIVLINQVGG